MPLEERPGARQDHAAERVASGLRAEGTQAPRDPDERPGALVAADRRACLDELGEDRLLAGNGPGLPVRFVARKPAGHALAADEERPDGPPRNLPGHARQGALGRVAEDDEDVRGRLAVELGERDAELGRASATPGPPPSEAVRSPVTRSSSDITSAGNRTAFAAASGSAAPTARRETAAATRFSSSSVYLPCAPSRNVSTSSAVAATAEGPSGAPPTTRRQSFMSQLTQLGTPPSITARYWAAAARWTLVATSTASA